MMAEAYYELMREAGLDREGNGDAAAMRRMGDLLCDRFNFDAAVRWYMKAADQGDACSQYFLGRCYCKGNHGVEQNFADGAKWLEKAAEQGHAEAQYFLGILYPKSRFIVT